MMQMKNVLILSCNTGQGHNSCAAAVKEYFEDRNVDCEIRDALEFVSKGFSKFISWGHSFMYRHIPSLFEWGYSYSLEHQEIFHEQSGIYACLDKGAKPLYHYIDEKHFDTVICTHVFSAIMLTDIQKNYPVKIQTAYVATDYGCHPGLDRCMIQQYFVPTEEIKKKLMDYGISEEQIALAAIPVRKYFISGEKDAKQKLHIETENKHLLVMCGSMGCGPIPSIMNQLAQKLPENVEVSVLCGTNQRLYRKLKNRYKRDSRIHVVSFTDEVPLYMDAADLYLTKPGGISVSEAAEKRLPMVLVDAVAGCERCNLEFFTQLGAAVTADSPEALAEKAISVLCSEKNINQMKQSFQNYIIEDGAKVIYEKMSERLAA